MAKKIVFAFVVFFNLSEILVHVIKTEKCLRGLVDRSTGSLTDVGLKLGWRTCGTA